MSWIKDKYWQFRNWQEQPFEYHDGKNLQVCCNCGKKIDNNYCPRCGQKTTQGPITWRSVWQGIMDIWGMGTRSLLYTLWQLIWRPGYLMRDYLSGKRQVGFPPVKMLVIVAILSMFITSFIDTGEENVTPITSTGVQYYIDTLDQWLNNHLDFNMLMLFSLLIAPVWFLFRYAPTFPRHSLPQGFFIQVFTAVQFITLVTIIVVPFYFFVSEEKLDIITSIILIVIAAVIIYCDYRQLFGYGRWSTLWRLLILVPLALSFVKVVVHFVRFMEALFNHGLEHESLVSLVATVDRVAFLWVALELINVINIKPWRKRSTWHSYRRSLLAFGILLLTTLLCYLVSTDNSFLNLIKSIKVLLE